MTGNGNDLVLSNFLFAENSGYGLYPVNWNASPWAKSSDRVQGFISSNKIALQGTKENTNLWFIECTKEGVVNDCYVKVSGIAELHNQLPDAAVIYSYRDGDSVKQTVLSDGVVFLKGEVTPGNYVPRMGFNNKTPLSTTLDTPVVIEQIPDYEGYLVTDGVDDKVVSSAFGLSKDWTIVGDWKFIPVDRDDLAGVSKSASFFLYNYAAGIRVYINSIASAITIDGVRSINAICSDGRIYLNDWTEVINDKNQTVSVSSLGITIGYNGTNFTQLAFKNLGIYNNRILSKEQCIQAYNYLQTLKNK